MRRLLALALLVAVAVAVGVLTLSGGGGGGGLPSQEQAIREIAARVVRGATAILMPKTQQATPGAMGLQVMLPANLVQPATPSANPQRDSTAASLFAGAGWRGALIAALAATRVPGLTQFVTTDTAGAQSPGSAFYLNGSVRMTPGQNPSAGMSKLDSVTPTAARRQLDDSLAVLRRGLPAGSLTAATITEIPVDMAHQRMAFDVELRVADLQRLSGHFGDIFSGLATGLAPGLDSTVEGLAIHVRDAAGRNAGSWMATRAQQGTTVVDPRLRLPRVIAPTLHFANETGGPNPLPSAHAAP
jgi:hypothetical protein